MTVREDRASGGVARSGATLRGIERLAVFNRLRAVVGLYWELPPLLRSVRMAAGSICLEIGTGLGWGTVGLLRKEPALTVVTTDYEGLILGKGRAFIRDKQPHSRVRYARADAKALPFSPGSFDVVLSLYVLHHAAGYRAALEEIARVLRPGGYLLMIDLIRPNFLPQLPASVAPDGVLTRSEWRGLLESCGFGIERWQTPYLLGLLPRCRVVALRLERQGSREVSTVPPNQAAAADGAGAASSNTSAGGAAPQLTLLV